MVNSLIVNGFVTVRADRTLSSVEKPKSRLFAVRFTLTVTAEFPGVDVDIRLAPVIRQSAFGVLYDAGRVTDKPLARLYIRESLYQSLWTLACPPTRATGREVCTRGPRQNELSAGKLFDAMDGSVDVREGSCPFDDIDRAHRITGIVPRLESRL